MGRTICLGETQEQIEDFEWPQILFLPTLDSNWNCAFRAAVADCRWIFVILDYTAGLNEEICYLRDNDLLAKTIAVMPPDLAGSYSPNDRRRRWRKVQNSTALHGFHVPDYDPRGAIYLPNADLSIRARQVLYGRSLPRLRSAIKPLLEQVPAGSRSMADFCRDHGDAIQAEYIEHLQGIMRGFSDVTSG